MGTWQAVIVATGTHDYFKTGDDTSAEQIIKKAVEELKAKGHNVHIAAVGPVNHQIKYDGFGTGPSMVQGAFMAEKPAVADAHIVPGPGQSLEGAAASPAPATPE